MRGFGRREFQLMLLRRMSDVRPELVRAALEAAGATRSDLLAAHVRWQRMVRSARFPAVLDSYRAVLGPADERTTHPSDLGELDVSRWAVPFWPRLRWQLVSGPAGHVLAGELVRAGPPVRVDPDPAPWTLVVADVLTDPAVRIEGPLDRGTPGRTVVTARPGDGPRTEYVFVWGLLQQVRPG